MKLVYGAGTYSDLICYGGVSLKTIGTDEEIKAELKEYLRLCKKHGEPIIIEHEDFFTLFRNGFLNTYAVI